MKPSNLSKIVGASVLSLSLLAVPAHAQTGTGGSGTGTGNSGTTVDNTSGRGTYDARGNRDDGFDLGWLGLLGLAGLAGLFGRKREEPVRYRDPDEVSRPGSRL